MPMCIFNDNGGAAGDGTHPNRGAWQAPPRLELAHRDAIAFGSDQVKNSLKFLCYNREPCWTFTDLSLVLLYLTKSHLTGRFPWPRLWFSHHNFWRPRHGIPRHPRPRAPSKHLGCRPPCTGCMHCSHPSCKRRRSMSSLCAGGLVCRHDVRSPSAWEFCRV